MSTQETNSETMPVERLAYSVKEVAQATGMSAISVYRLIQRGHLRAIQPLRHKIIPKRELERFLRESLE